VEITARVGDSFPVEGLGGLARPAVVWFFPQSGTPGCTREAREFNRLYDRFQAAGIEVIGVSTDTAEAQRRFAEEEALRLPLVPDPEGRLVSRLGLLKDYGEYGTLSARVTFLVDRDGVIRRIWSVEDVMTHPEATLAAAKELLGEPTTA
jgi:peroxiredoxin Q/BCP